MSGNTKKIKDEHSHWGRVYMISGIVAISSLFTAVFIDHTVGGILFTFSVIGFLGYLAVMKGEETSRRDEEERSQR